MNINEKACSNQRERFKIMKKHEILKYRNILDKLDLLTPQDIYYLCDAAMQREELFFHDIDL